MKVNYKTCCGVDVHKSFLVATIITTISGIEPSYQKKRYSTLNNSILGFKKWLFDNLLEDETKDSKWVADLFCLGLVKGSYILCKKSVFYVSLQGIAISLSPAVPVKRIDIRMRLLFIM